MSSQASKLQNLVGQFRIRKLPTSQNNGSSITAMAKSIPAPVAVSKPTPVVAKPTPSKSKDIAKPITPPKTTVNKPIKPASSPSPSVEVDDDHWGGGAEIKIDLDDKSFGKY
jgi:hypothetical protein